MHLSPDTLLADLAVEIPAATKVFHRHGLDFCCHGRRSVADACREKALDPAAVLAEIEDEASASPPADVAWAERSAGELIEHITRTFHEPLRETYPRLLDMAHKIERVHAEKASCPRGLAEHLEETWGELQAHLEKEELVLFPRIREGLPVDAPVWVMTQEHLAHAAHLQRTRSLAHGFQPPDDACTTWRALYAGLGELERDLMEHIHLENNVLFPRTTPLTPEETP